MSTSSINSIMKSTSLCFSMSSVWKFVIRKEISYPCEDHISTSIKLIPGVAVLTFTGFLLRMKKASARCVKNLVNLCTRICSISSACLILMLIRTLFMLGSMKTRSFSLRAIVKGFRSTSGELAASISGTLCLSEVWDAKSASERAAVREERTHWRYGRRD